MSKNLTISKKMHEEYEEYLLKVVPYRKPVFAKGKGSYLEDVDGNKYLDLESGQFCLALGHVHEEFNKTICNQLNKIIHTDTLTLTEEVLKALKQISTITSPGLQKSILLSTGAEAVECALRYAKKYTNKKGVVGVKDGYHGLTIGTQSISSDGLYALPRVPFSYSIPTPDWLSIANDKNIQEYIEDCITESEALLEPHKGEIAAFIIEPVISVGGMIFPPKEYFIALQKLAKKHEAVLIFDECQTGLGRTGKWFGYEHLEVVPDMLILAKTAGLGIPVSAVVMSTKIAEKIEGKLIHFSSHQNDPLAGISIDFLIKYIKENNILENVNKMGDYFLSELDRISKSFPIISNPRGLGLMIGFDVSLTEYTKNPQIGFSLLEKLEQNGVIIQVIRKGRTFRILPNYLISKEEIDFFISVFVKCIKELKNE